MSGWTGVDFSRLDPDQVVEHVENDAGRTCAREHHPRRSGPRLDGAAGRRACLDRRHRADRRGLSGDVADQLEGWIDETDIDGFNLCFVVAPRPSRTSSTSSCRNCSGAAATKRATFRAPCAKSSPAAARAYRTTIPPRDSAGADLRAGTLLRAHAANCGHAPVSDVGYKAVAVSNLHAMIR